jgi:hypothetical protein
MGLIKEPRNVDFYVIDKVWTAKELKEFRIIIQEQKNQSIKKKLMSTKKK